MNADPVIAGPGYGSAGEITLRIHGPAGLPVLVHLPGLHGDWTLVSGFRRALAERVRFVEVTYAQTLTATLSDQAWSIARALAAAGVTRGWIIGESFGSQIAWDLVSLAGSPFAADGLVLAGGFVRHPWPWGARWMRRVSSAIPQLWARLFAGMYGRYARWRHRREPESVELLGEFVRRRASPVDRRAIARRLVLIEEGDPRPLARAARLPIHDLGGWIDPLVPLPLVRRWLRRECPGYRGGRILWADHNVLGTAPAASAALILEWMGVTAVAARTVTSSPNTVASRGT